ncbi:hypothetical protein C8Q75DRAFT_805358 [Abortiporus biennis]|nr:hypothetical protein C8Q75DRAFT_805358 [Abortiporus biennis]
MTTTWSDDKYTSQQSNRELFSEFFANFFSRLNEPCKTLTSNLLTFVTVKAKTMGSVTFVNNTSSTIHIRVSTTGSGDEHFFDIAPGRSDRWGRDDWQVAWVLRDDNGRTETYVVKPGSTYQIS